MNPKWPIELFQEIKTSKVHEEMKYHKCLPTT